jgi:type I restriction enzyme S subunit
MNKIPNGWTSSTVGDACTIRNNLRLPINSDERESIKGDFPYFGPTGILSFINDYKIDDSFALIGEDGDHFLKFKEKEMTLFFSGKANVNNHAHIICDSSLCKARWFYFSFMHADITSHLTRQGAKRYKLTKASLEKLPILVPPLPEQIKIASILSTWDNAINTVQKLLANSQQQKKSLMQQLLTGKKRFSEFEGEWEEKRLGDVCSPQQWPTISSKDLVSNGYSVYGANGFIGYYFEYNHKNETVAVTCRGSTCGEVSLIPEKSYVTGNSMCLDDVNEKRYAYRYLYYFLKNRGFNDVISGSAQPQIVGSAIRKVKVLIPSLPEQQKIATILTTADQEIDNLRAQLNHLKQEKKALMQQLLTGKRRVKIEEAA